VGEAPKPAAVPPRLEADAGVTIHAIAAEIFPLCRSITGDGVRETLRRLGLHIPLDVVEVESGSPACDWTVPDEWTIRAAYIENAAGERIVDFRANPLHVMSYSVAVDEVMPLDALKRHVFTLPEQPDLIPYRTSYYAPCWGFCMAHRQLEALPDGPYRAVIDADLAPGRLTYGECYLPGETPEEVLLSAHICHPGMANDNCSGLALLTYLAKQLTGEKKRYSYRFLFAPGTIGALTWLARNEQAVSRIRHGLVLSCVGDGGGPYYKRSRRGNAPIDRAMDHVLRLKSAAPEIVDFVPYGYDERQFCSPGFNLPVGLFQRSRYASFPEYHTSADTMDFITPEHLAESHALVRQALFVIENDRLYRNLFPKGEPQLGRRGLYDALGGDPKAAEKNLAMLWVLNLSDGAHSLLDIAERAKMPFATILASARLLERHKLIAPVLA
jgi:aminopeptidase-like protein